MGEGTAEVEAPAFMPGRTSTWLWGFSVNCFEALPDHLHVQPISGNHDVMIQRLAVEADEMARVVQ